MKRRLIGPSHGRPTKKKDAVLTAYSNNTPYDNKATFIYAWESDEEK